MGPARVASPLDFLHVVYVVAEKQCGHCRLLLSAQFYSRFCRGLVFANDPLVFLAVKVGAIETSETLFTLPTGICLVKTGVVEELLPAVAELTSLLAQATLIIAANEGTVAPVGAHEGLVFE